MLHRDFNNALQSSAPRPPAFPQQLHAYKPKDRGKVVRHWQPSFFEGDKPPVGVDEVTAELRRRLECGVFGLDGRWSWKGRARVTAARTPLPGADQGEVAGKALAQLPRGGDLRLVPSVSQERRWKVGKLVRFRHPQPEIVVFGALEGATVS